MTQLETPYATTYPSQVAPDTTTNNTDSTKDSWQDLPVDLAAVRRRAQRSGRKSSIRHREKSVADLAAAAVRRANARDCLGLLLDDPRPLTVAELSVRSGLSRPTVEAVLQDLIAAGPVHSIEPSESNAPGRPARRFTASAATSLVAGVELAPGMIRCTVADASGQVVARTRTPLDPGAPDDLLDAVAEAVLETVRSRPGNDHDSRADAGSPRPRLTAVGLALPGVLDHDQRLARGDAMPELTGMDVAAELSQRLGCTVAVDNDLKLAAYAEHHLARTADNLIFVKLGSRISLAVMVDGRIVQGSRRMAGEFGGQPGMRWTSACDDEGLRWSTGRDARPVFDRAAAGDRQAIAEIDGFCAEIAPRLATLVLALDPEAVVIGGALSNAGAVLLDPLRHHLDQLLTGAPPLVAAGLADDGAEAGALGHAFAVGSQQILGIPEVPPPWCRLRTTWDHVDLGSILG